MARQALLVTGVNGFLGEAIAAACQADGLCVRGTSRSPAPGASWPHAVADLVDSSALPPLFDGVDLVVHAAGLAHRFPGMAEDPGRFFAVNATATGRLARLAGERGVRH